MCSDCRVRLHPAARHQSGENFMRALIVGLALSTFAASAFAAGETCSAQAAEKKLAGAAKNSFVKKCTGDAQKTCDASAAEKKLSGAAKNSFVKKCVKDAAGA